MAAQSLKQILNHPDFLTNVIKMEGAFRRGYLHGYLAAIRDVQQHGLQATCEHEDQLAEWRETNRDQMIDPPALRTPSFGNRDF